VISPGGRASFLSEAPKAGLSLLFPRWRFGPASGEGWRSRTRASAALANRDGQLRTTHCNRRPVGQCADLLAVRATCRRGCRRPRIDLISTRWKVASTRWITKRLSCPAYSPRRGVGGGIFAVFSKRPDYHRHPYRVQPPRGPHKPLTDAADPAGTPIALKRLNLFPQTLQRRSRNGKGTGQFGFIKRPVPPAGGLAQGLRDPAPQFRQGNLIGLPCSWKNPGRRPKTPGCPTSSKKHRKRLPRVL